MAAARNNLTRRAVLGAAFAVPAILGGAARAREVSGSGRARWQAALACLQNAEAALEAYRANEMRPADDAFNAVRRRWPISYDFGLDAEAGAALKVALTAYQPFEDRLNDLECGHLEVIKRLLRAPAPDLPALATKIELAVDYEVAELEGGEQCLAVLKSDALRLARASAN